MKFRKILKLVQEEENIENKIVQPSSSNTEQQDNNPVVNQNSGVNNQPTSQPGSKEQPVSQPGSGQKDQPNSEATQPSSLPGSNVSDKIIASKPGNIPLEEIENKFGTIHSSTIVISAFPGCGKSTFCTKHDDSKDLESCLYSKKPDGDRNPDFPKNYIDMIKWHLVNNNWKYIFVSSHDDVRKSLTDDGIVFFLLYPDINRKNEFIELYRNRGNNDEFIKLMEENWETWINEMSKEPRSYALTEGEFINDDLFENKLKHLKQ